MKTEDKRLEEAKEGVLEYFRKIAAVPHDSGHEGALAREMREWLKNVNGVSTIDDAGNLICDIPATPGCENAPLLMLAGTYRHGVRVARGLRLGSSARPCNAAHTS